MPPPYVHVLASSPTLNLTTILGGVAALELAFQIGHFAEHAFQFAVWVLGDLSNICGRDTPWMSPWANELVGRIGFALPSVGGCGAARRRKPNP